MLKASRSNARTFSRAELFHKPLPAIFLPLVFDATALCPRAESPPCYSPGSSAQRKPWDTATTYPPACRAGTPTYLDAVPALQAGERLDGVYPGLRSWTRSSLGYNLAGFQPSELARFEKGIPTDQNEIMQGRGVRNDSGHKLFSKVMLKLAQIVVGENSAPGKKLFAFPIIQAQQFTSPTARDQALGIGPQHQPLRDNTQSLRRFEGQ